jgi:Rod binding domain-containing protein
MDNAVQSMGNLALQQATLPSLNPGAGANIDKTAQDFTGMFFAQMLQPMFESAPVDPIFGGGHGEEVMRGFLVQEYGKVVAQGHFGLTDAVKQEMIRAQAKAGQNRLRGGTYDAVQ